MRPKISIMKSALDKKWINFALLVLSLCFFCSCSATIYWCDETSIEETGGINVVVLFGGTTNRLAKFVSSIWIVGFLAIFHKSRLDKTYEITVAGKTHIIDGISEWHMWLGEVLIVLLCLFFSIQILEENIDMGEMSFMFNILIFSFVGLFYWLLRSFLLNRYVSPKMLKIFIRVIWCFMAVDFVMFWVLLFLKIN